MNAHPQGSTPAERPEDAADAPEVFTSRRARRAAEARRAAAGTDAAAAETEAVDAAAAPQPAADHPDAAAWAAAGPETQPLSTVSDGLLAERWATGHSDRPADTAQRHPAPADAQAGSTETPSTDTPSAESAGPVVHAAAPLTRRSNRPGTSRAPGTPGAPAGDGVWRRFFTGRPHTPVDFLLLWTAIAVTMLLVTGIFALFAGDPVGFLRMQGTFVGICLAVLAVAFALLWLLGRRKQRSRRP